VRTDATDTAGALDAFFRASLRGVPKVVAVVGRRQHLQTGGDGERTAAASVAGALATVVSPGGTGIIQLYPLPFVYTVTSDLCRHLPTCGSAAIVRIQDPNMEKRVRLAGLTRISARKIPLFG